MKEPTTMKNLPNETEAFFRWLLIQIGEAKEEDFAPATETDIYENYENYENED